MALCVGECKDINNYVKQVQSKAFYNLNHVDAFTYFRFVQQAHDDAKRSEILY